MRKHKTIAEIPNLIQDWDYEKNEDMDPQLITAGNSKVKVWWKCDRKHSWRCSPGNRMYGTGCPYCKGKLPIVGETDLESQRPDLMNLWDQEQEVLPSTVTCHSMKKVFWICEKGHRWEAAVKDVVAGNRCPICAGKRVLKGFNDLATLYPEIAAEWDYEKNGELLPDQITAAVKAKMWWLCKRGHSWSATVYHRKYGTGCPYCSGNLPIQGENDLATLYPELVKEWHAEKNPFPPESCTAFSPRKVWWKCAKGHEWRTGIYYRTKGKTGCPYCYGKKAVPGESDLATLYPYLAEEWDYERNFGLDPTSTRPASGKRVWWVCRNGHHWRTSVQTRTEGKGCPYCLGKIPTYSRLI